MLVQHVFCVSTCQHMPVMSPLAVGSLHDSINAWFEAPLGDVNFDDDEAKHIKAPCIMLQLAMKGSKTWQTEVQTVQKTSRNE